MTIFRQKAYNIVKKIPRGKVMTYAAVARAIGNPRAARAVGNILSRNDSPEIPCHRIVRSDGVLGKYNGLQGTNKH